MAGETEDQGGGAGGADDQNKGGDEHQSLADTAGQKAGDGKGGEGDKGQKGPPAIETIAAEHHVKGKDGKVDYAATLAKAGLAHEAVPEKYRVMGADGKLDAVATLAKLGVANGELAKKFGEQAAKMGGFKGAPVDKDGKPVDYELTLPTDKDGKPLVEGEFDKDHPLLKGFQAIARNAGMSQEVFTQALHEFVKWEATRSAVDLKAELDALGENGQQRVNDVTAWARANLSEEQFEDYRHVTTTAGGFRMVETLLGMMRQAGKAPNEGGTGDGAALDAQIAVLLKPNEKGERPIDLDQGKLAEYRRLLALKVGTGPDVQVVGRQQ